MVMKKQHVLPDCTTVAVIEALRVIWDSLDRIFIIYFVIFFKLEVLAGTYVCVSHNGDGTN